MRWCSIDANNRSAILEYRSVQQPTSTSAHAFTHSLFLSSRLPLWGGAFNRGHFAVLLVGLVGHSLRRVTRAWTKVLDGIRFLDTGSLIFDATAATTAYAVLRPRWLPQWLHVLDRATFLWNRRGVQHLVTGRRGLGVLQVRVGHHVRDLCNRHVWRSTVRRVAWIKWLSRRIGLECYCWSVL